MPDPTPNAENAAAEALITPLFVWRAIRKNWLFVVAATIVLTLGSTFYTLGKTKIYRATATLQIDPTPPKPLGNEVQTVVDIGAGYWANREYYETQFKIIQSHRIALETVSVLGLQHDMAFVSNSPPGVSPPHAEVPVDVAASALRGRIIVDPVKDSRLVVVSLEDANPERAQRVLMALVDTYVQRNVEDVLTSANTANDWLTGQTQKLKKELEANEMALHDYKKEKAILSVSIDDQSNMLRAEMTQLNEDLTRVRARAQAIASRRDELNKIAGNDPSDLPATELLSSALLQSLRGDYLQAKRDRDSSIGRGKGSNHPDVLAAGANAETTKTALLAEIKNIKQAVEKDLSATQREEKGLSRLFEGAKRRAMDLNLLEIEYGRLLRNKNTTEKLYSLVVERSKESDVTRMMRFNNIRVIDSALLPGAPVRPNVPFSVSLGLMGGLALGLMLALGRELLDRSIKTPDDVEQDLKVTFLGLLPVAGAQTGYGRRSRRRRDAGGSARQAELIVHAEPTSGVAEAARAIRTNIFFMSPDTPFRRLLVTSAGPSEGKTTVACSIAIALAQAGQRVLLVDCDLRRPRVHKVFGRSNDVGVSSAVIDHSVLDQVDLSTEIPNLSVLPCGPHVPSPAELLQSESFSRLLTELQSRYDRLVIDSPPIAPVTDATILSTKVDGTVVVVRAFHTTRDLAKQALRALKDVSGRLVGVVLNAVDLGRREYGYYQYYYYKKDGYGPKPDSDSENKES
ncbi:MAG: polysaccharide biosynthesis tyrosine autokinase [Myxococcales bacterium]|nr:polysaccharide biosynthesis tyrosine autokinase [Myxococcales bacterium]